MKFLSGTKKNSQNKYENGNENEKKNGNVNGNEGGKEKEDECRVVVIGLASNSKTICR